MATKGIRDGVTRAEEGAAPAGACENPWGHNVSALLSLTVESDKRRRALVRHQCGAMPSDHALFGSATVPCTVRGLNYFSVVRCQLSFQNHFTYRAVQ